MSKLYLFTRCATTISALRWDASEESNSIASWAGDISTRLFVTRRFLAGPGAVFGSWTGAGSGAGSRLGPGSGRGVAGGKAMAGVLPVPRGTTGIERFGGILQVGWWVNLVGGRGDVRDRCMMRVTRMLSWQHST